MCNHRLVQCCDHVGLMCKECYSHINCKPVCDECGIEVAMEGSRYCLSCTNDVPSLSTTDAITLIQEN